jgi:anti-sigma-K factor RskA
MRYDEPQLQEALAAAYVAGALQGPARRRFEALMRTRPALRRRVDAWEDRLTPLADGTPAVQPPARVWRALRQRISPRDPAPAQGAGIWNSLAFWRPFGAMATAAAVMLIAYAGFIAFQPAPAPQIAESQPQQITPSYLAVLEDETRQPVMVVTAFRGPWRLTVEPLHELLPEDGKVYQIWAVERGSGTTRPLLQVSGSDVLRQPLGTDGWELIKMSESLMVTLEDAGPAPTAPSGPALYSGLCLNLKAPTEI